MVEVKVNEAQWNAVDPETQENIRKSLVDAKLLPPDVQIVASDQAPEVVQTEATTWGFPGDVLNPILPKGNPITDAICDAAASAGMAACAAYSGPAYIACVAAVEVARRECKS